jgi:hypothetical protein
MREIMTSGNGFILLAAFCAGLALDSALATEVYRWVDEDGVVHFSQMAPPGQETDVSKMSLADTRPSDYDPDADIYGVAEQEKRMKAMRDDMEQRRQDRLERQRQAASQAPVQYRDYESYGYPVYWNPGLRPKPPLRPVPPIARPDPGPGQPIRPPGMINPPSPIKPR